MFMLIEKTSLNTEKTILFVIAFLLAGIERFIPVFPLLPWLKIGLFHAITLIWIVRFGIFDALAFIFVRQWVIAAFFGFSLLPFVLGTTGSVMAVILGGILIKSQKFSIIAAAVFSALVHNITQLFVLFLIMSGNLVWQWQLPVMAVVSIFTGTVTGFLAFEINKISFQFCEIKNSEEKIETKADYFAIFTLISVIILTVIFENYWFYSALFLIICAISKPNLFDFVKRYWIFIFALYISSSFSLMQVSKISIWFLLTPFFQKSGFFTLFYELLLKIFPKKCSETLAVGAVMPQIFPQILEELPNIVKIVFKNPKNVSQILIEKSRKILLEWKK
jgi:heptaprenyl diphosphate synthase